MGYEQPRYLVEQSHGDIEVRRYESYVVAETEVEGDRQSAGSEGFRRLFAYILGKNEGSTKLAMTSPVTETKGTKIAMTAPVTETAAGNGQGSFVVQFMMPSHLTLDSLPKPLDHRVRLRRIPTRRLAALRYSGSWSEKRYRTHLNKLRAAMQRERLKEAGEPIWARYDPPFKPWFLRRNEILIEI